MTLPYRWLVLGALLVHTSACADAGPEPSRAVGERADGIASANGITLNGITLNGITLNGITLNGITLNGITLNGITLNGSALQGVGSDGITYEGAGFVGAELQAQLSGGATLPLHVEAARSADDVWFYQLSYTNGAGRQALCGLDGAGAPVEAVALAGRWDLREGVPGGGSWIDDPSAFTLACRGAALTKCVELGYKPWASAGGVPLRDYHQACTRLLRADYCGNGQPGTMNGWQINLYDNLGVQGDTESGATWVFEGAWGATGASCVDEYRLLELVAHGPVPECALAKLSGACAGGGFTGGVLLRSEYNSTGLVGLVRDIVTGNPGTELADKVEDALAKLEVAFAELAKVPSNRLAAVSQIEAALGEVKGTVDEGLLPPGYGLGLINRVVGVARFQATAVIGENSCNVKNPKDLLEAQKRQIEGDKLRAAYRYKDACAKYKEAIDKAEDALGSPCSP